MLHVALRIKPHPGAVDSHLAGGGPIGDGKLATEAVLKLPNDVAVDRDGNLYIADSTNHRIRKVDGRTGVISTIAGGGTSGLADGGPAAPVRAEVAGPPSPGSLLPPLA